jgi:pyruvate formate lyase activating enzyme
VAVAREVVGRSVTVAELVAEVERDRVFYQTSGGGVTVGGGEPTLQAAFTGAFLRKCREEGLHTALDTCGHAPWDTLESLARYSDLILFDLKLYREDRHRDLTGVGRDLIFDNLRRLDGGGRRLWVRIPIIPGCTDDEENLEGLGKILRPLENVERIELLAYHKLGEEKYRRLDRAYAYAGAKTPTREDILRCAALLQGLPLRAEIKF